MTTTTSDAQPRESGKVFVLVHGSFHGAWAFEKLTPLLIQHGHQVIARDLPGHGLHTRLPRSFRQEPVDTEAMATEVSPIGDIDLAACVDPVISLVSEIQQQRPEDEIILVGHSFGGLVLSMVGEAVPDKVGRLVYLTGYMVPSGQTAMDCLATDEFATSLLPQLPVADPATIGALRINPRSTDPDYLTTLKTTLADDVDDDTWEAARHLLISDTPAAAHAVPITTTVERWGSIPRTYISCTGDRSFPVAAQQQYIRAADAFTPGNRTDVREIAASHSAYWSQPGQLAEILLNL